MIPYPLNYIWDIFGWLYYEDRIIHGDSQIKIGRFDITTKEFKYKKLGKFLAPEKGQYIQIKNKFMCIHRDDDANALANIPIFIMNTDSDKVTHLQQVTTTEDLSNVPESVVKDAMATFRQNKKGAITLLNCKTNPFLLESMMDNNALKALKQIDESPLSWIQDNIILVIIIIVIVLGALYYFSGGRI